MTREGEIRARLDAATPAPWEARKPAWRPYEIWQEAARGDAAESVCATFSSGPQSAADADLIAHAPEDLAYLLAENARLRGALERIAWIIGPTLGPRLPQQGRPTRQELRLALETIFQLQRLARGLEPTERHPDV